MLCALRYVGFWGSPLHKNSREHPCIKEPPFVKFSYPGVFLVRPEFLLRRAEVHWDNGYSASRVYLLCKFYNITWIIEYRKAEALGFSQLRSTSQSTSQSGDLRTSSSDLFLRRSEFPLSQWNSRVASRINPRRKISNWRFFTCAEKFVPYDMKPKDFAYIFSCNIRDNVQNKPNSEFNRMKWIYLLICVEHHTAVLKP